MPHGVRTSSSTITPFMVFAPTLGILCQLDCGAGVLTSPAASRDGRRKEVALGERHRCLGLGGYQSDFARNLTRKGRDISDLTREVVDGTLGSAGLDGSQIGVVHVSNAWRRDHPRAAVASFGAGRP